MLLDLIIDELRDRVPSIASKSSSLGMATISFALSATLIWPSTRRWRAAKAETM